MIPFPKIENAELLLVGGTVRDTIMGKEPKDRDFVVATFLSFDDLCTNIEGMGGVIFQRKPEFLTIRAKFGRETIDIAFPRGDGAYTDGRHPDTVTRVNTLEADAARRDFTINAMYMREDGEVLDFFGGKQDLLHRNLRCVGDPETRFKEDPLRILRALRFEAKLGCAIWPTTVAAMRTCTPLLENVVAERIQQEIDATFNCITRELDMSRFLNSLIGLGILPIMFEKGVRLRATLAEPKGH